MTIASNKNTPRNTYTATGGQTAFTIGFEFFKVEDVKVYRNGSLLTYNASPSSVSQYKITGTASASDDAYEFGAGGTVTLGAGATADDIIVIIRDITLERTSDFPTTGAFDITTLNTQLDTMTSMLSDIKQQSDRSVKLLDTDTVSSTITLPAKATRQSKVLGFDANGNIETTVSSDGLATLSGIASDISTVAGISSNVTSVAGNSSNINTVAGLNSEITSLGAIASDITTLAGFNSADISTVAGDIAKVVTAANDLNESTSEIEVVANSIANVDAVGGDIANVNAIAPHIPNVNSVASNLSGINSFAERYRIQAGVPSTSNDVGDLVFDTTAQKLKVFDGSSYQLAGSSVNGTSQRFKFTATANQTTFSGNDDDSNSLTYDPLFLDVYLNGVRLVNGSSNDFVATNGTSIVLNAGASAGDILNVVSFGTFSLASINTSAITAGTLPISRGGTGLSSVSGNADKVLKVNPAGNAFILGQASSPEVYGFNMSYVASTINYTVGVQSVSSANKYFIMGEQQPTLELYEGNTYIFDWSAHSSHPFRFSTTSNGTHGGGTEYTTGVTVDTSNYKTTIVVASSAPTLYYYCQYHSGMGGQANTPVPFNNNVQVTTTNQGADDIDATTYAGFDDVLFSASGFTFSLNNGDLIATI